MSKAWEKMSRAGKILLVVASSIGFLLVTYIILIIINLNPYHYKSDWQSRSHSPFFSMCLRRMGGCNCKLDWPLVRNLVRGLWKRHADTLNKPRHVFSSNFKS
jgi:hypothetical protein